MEKFEETKHKLHSLQKDVESSDTLQDLMKKPPLHIQYVKETPNRGSRYCISKKCPFLPEPRKHVYSCGKKATSDQDKFKEILRKYDYYTGSHYCKLVGLEELEDGP